MLQSMEERLCGKGIGNALAVFRDRGMLGKAKFFGRNKDETAAEIFKSFGDKDN